MNRKQWSSRPGRSSNWITPTRRFAIYHRDGFKCLYCQKGVLAYDGVGLTLDHVLSRKEGGGHESKNLVTSCLKCNSKRQHKALRSPTLNRLRVYLNRELNMEVGKLLALLQRRCRGQVNPLMAVPALPPMGIAGGRLFTYECQEVPSLEFLNRQDAAQWRDFHGIKDNV